MATFTLSNPRTGTGGRHILFDVTGGTLGGTLLVDPTAVTVQGTSDGYTGTTLGTNARTYKVGHHATFSGGVLTMKMQHLIHLDDVSLTVVVNAGAIDDGTDQNGALGSTAVTNNSTQVYLVPLLRFAGVTTGENDLGFHGHVVDSVFAVECDAFHVYGLANVRISVTDGSTTQNYDITEKTRSRYRDTNLIDATQWAANSNGGLGVYSSGDIAPTDFLCGTLTVTITAYPLYGDTTRVDTVTLYNNNGSDSGNILPTKTLYADQVNGNDANGGTDISTDAFQTFDAVCTALQAFQSTHICFAELANGSYSLAQIGTPYFNVNRYLTVQKHSSATVAGVILTSGTAGGVQTRIKYQRYKDLTLDITNGGTGANILLSNNTTLYPDASAPAYVWFDGVVIENSIGRDAQRSSSTNFIATTFGANSIWAVSRCTIQEMNQDGLISNPAKLYCRDLGMMNVSGDLFKAPSLLFAAVAEDNRVPTTNCPISVTSGTPAASDTMSAGGGAVTATVTEYDAVNNLIFIDTSGGKEIWDFKAYDGVTDAISFSPSGAVATITFPHPDGVQFAASLGDRNAIMANIWFKNADGQQMFIQGADSNICGYNLILEHAIGGLSNFISQDAADTEHCGYDYVTSPNQKLHKFSTGTWVGKYLRNSIVRAAQHENEVYGGAGVDITNLYQRTGSVTGQIDTGISPNITAGFESGLGIDDEYSDISQNYMPTAASAMRSKVAASEQTQKYDIFGNLRATDGSGAIGAVEYVAPAAGSSEVMALADYPVKGFIGSMIGNIAL